MVRSEVRWLKRSINLHDFLFNTGLRSFYAVALYSKLAIAFMLNVIEFRSHTLDSRTMKSNDSGDNANN
jgi:hypothetical protein